MTVEQQLLYQKIGEILWFEWDPIGVNYLDTARDEYESYVPTIFGLKVKGADSETIAVTLFEMESKTMCLKGNMERCRSIGDKIMALDA